MMKPAIYNMWWKEATMQACIFSSWLPLPGQASAGMGGSYTYNDPNPVGAQSFYRIELIDHAYHNYSRIILLSNTEIALEYFRPGESVHPPDLF